MSAYTAIVSRRKTALLASVAFWLLAPLAQAADLPTGGQIVGGSGSIAQSGTAMTITQSSAQLSATWDSFSIGAGHSVTFNQPSADAVAVNRVLGSDVSTIQGSLSANGHVFLINPNGVTFTPDAQVNVGGLVASTLDLKDADFAAGKYTFEGDSDKTITNAGHITTANGGTVALVAAKIINTGDITADEGNVLLGAGQRVTIDMGGPVKLAVEKGALDAQIDQGGAIRADGGRIYMTAKAADDLASSVINHTGVTQARTLASGKNGEIILMGGMSSRGRVKVAGKIDASAPMGGDGGFVETSAGRVTVDDGAHVMTASATGESGTWLIDPNNYTIAASGGDISGATLAGNLAGGNIVVATTGAGGNLYVNDTVAWAANKLTLRANNNIYINRDLSATGTGSLAYEYGQDSANGAGSSYTVANGVHVMIPSSGSFTWKKGSAGAVNNLWFGNQYLSITTSKSAALTADGALLQPFYYDNGTSGRAAGWYKLTYNTYPLDFALGTGGDGTNSWNHNGQILSTNGATAISGARAGLKIDIGKYNEGIGTLTSTLTVNVAETGSTADIINAYTLEADKNFIRTETTVKNNSTTTDLTNVRVWVGTRDDWVGMSDGNYKTKGNLGADGFTQIANASDQAKAIKITEQINGTGAAVLFYSTSAGADTVTDRCCSFNNVMNKDPHASATQTGREDGSYALFLRMNNLSAGATDSLVWYYGAGQASQIETIVTQVAQSSGAAPTPPPYTPPAPTPTPTPTVTNEVPRESAITAVQAAASNLSSVATPSTTNGSNGGTQGVRNGPAATGLAALMLGSRPQTQLTVGSMEIVNINSHETAGNSGSQQGGDGGNRNSNVFSRVAQQSLLGPTRVFVVDGGVKIPSHIPVRVNRIRAD